MRLGELRSAVRLTQPSLSRAVARLERHGWLRRAGAPGDGRGVLVSVTASGREVLAQGSAVHTQTISELLLDRLTPDEQDLLARALTRVAEGGHSPDRAGALMAQPAAFGLNVNPNAGGLAIAGRIAAIADSAGLEYVGIQDHPYNADFLDTFTVITWLAARTSRVHLFPNVANLPLRPPAMLAKQAATIDVLSGGRFELGLGAGAFADGIAGMGGPRRTPARPARRSARPSTSSGPAGRGSRSASRAPTTRRPPRQPGPRPAHPSGCGSAWWGRARRAWSAPRPTAGRCRRPTCPPERLPELNDIITGGRAGGEPRSRRDHPAVQRHGADHPGGPGPVPRPGRSAGSRRWPACTPSTR